MKARDLAAELTSAGFACALDLSEPVAVEAPAALSPADDVVEAQESDFVIEARREPDVEPEPQYATAQLQVDVVDEEPSVEEVSEVAETDGLSAQLEEVLSEPAQSPQPAASHGPADLTAHASQEPAQSSRTAPVGRLVGAAPETQITTDAFQQPASTPATSVTPAAIVTTRNVSPNRKTEDIIRATLDAQAAAWNEGDLEAFMETYWKDDELKFVSDTTITKSWSSTMKRYRENYAGPDGFGLLGFERMDVQLITDDVAVVTGRFNIASSGQASGGVFTLVMKQFDGAWRIVHDHTNADAVSAE